MKKLIGCKRIYKKHCGKLGGLYYDQDKTILNHFKQDLKKFTYST